MISHSPLASSLLLHESNNHVVPVIFLESYTRLEKMAVVFGKYRLSWGTAAESHNYK